MILAATGHRPHKLGGYGVDVRIRLRRLAMITLESHRPDAVISGMAQGWDTAIAAAALALEIPLIAAIPFSGQELLWPDDSQELYHRLLAKADHVAFVCAPGYAAWKMQRRNEWMVDACTDLVALWDGSDGGTANCVEYAKGKVPIHDVWNDWLRLVHGEKAPVSRAPRVLNKYTATAEEQRAAVNIMRLSKWGNPFRIGDGYGHIRQMNREQVIAKHEDWLLHSDVGRVLLKDIGELRGRDLLCCCAPKPCHGDVLLRLANGGDA